jgi:hypothetical protein
MPTLTSRLGAYDSRTCALHDFIDRLRTREGPQAREGVLQFAEGCRTPPLTQKHPLRMPLQRLLVRLADGIFGHPDALAVEGHVGLETKAARHEGAGAAAAPFYDRSATRVRRGLVKSILALLGLAELGFGRRCFTSCSLLPRLGGDGFLGRPRSAVSRERRHPTPPPFHCAIIYSRQEQWPCASPRSSINRARDSEMRIPCRVASVTRSKFIEASSYKPYVFLRF